MDFVNLSNISTVSKIRIPEDLKDINNVIVQWKTIEKPIYVSGDGILFEKEEDKTIIDVSFSPKLNKYLNSLQSEIKNKLKEDIDTISNKYLFNASFDKILTYIQHEIYYGIFY